MGAWAALQLFPCSGPQSADGPEPIESENCKEHGDGDGKRPLSDDDLLSVAQFAQYPPLREVRQAGRDQPDDYKGHSHVDRCLVQALRRLTLMDLRQSSKISDHSE